MRQHATTRHLRRWVVFNTVGLAGFAVQIGGLAVLTRLAGWHVVPATIVVMEAVIVQNYLAHSRWTWADTPARTRRERILRPLGLFRAKAKSLKECSRQLVEKFGGEVPATMAELTRLAGVGRKTANVILGHAFNVPGVIVDTHCKRLSRRLGLSRQQDPAKIERDLSCLLPAKEWTGLSHRLIIHGRRICQARKPACDQCVLADLCPSNRANPGVQGSGFKVQRKR